MFPLLPYTHIHTEEQLTLHIDGCRHSKIDLIIRRNWNRHRLVFLDFLAADCYSGAHFRLRLDENTYINLPEDDSPQPITLTDFYRELRDFISHQKEIIAELAEDGETVVIKLFSSSPLLFLERLDDNQMIEVIKETKREEQKESMLREEFRARWTRLVTQMLSSSPKVILPKADCSEVNYITALRYGLRKSPAVTAPRRSRRRSLSTTRQ